ncbi:Uncharacterised protein [Mycobacterium tuberculosis]|nr:Uncharacterised protein [Mycobacterium tuberculosis]
MQPAAFHAAAGAGHNHGGVFCGVGVADSDRGSSLTAECHWIVGEQVYRGGVPGIITGVMVEAFLGLIGVAVAGDIAGGQTVFRRITQDVVNRRAVPSGDVTYPIQVPRHHRDVGIAARADRNAVEIADLFRVLGDQTLPFLRRQRRPPPMHLWCPGAWWRNLNRLFGFHRRLRCVQSLQPRPVVAIGTQHGQRLLQVIRVSGAYRLQLAQC